MIRVLAAIRFAAAAHGAQVRKYTGEPYIVHPLEVAQTVAQALPDDENAIIAAILHDTVEDTAVTIGEVANSFGEDVASLVFGMTDPKTEGNRALRKAAARDALAQCSPRVKTIKLADLLNNTKSIVTHDPNFAKVYMREKRDLLPALKEGDAALFQQCKFTVDSYFHLAGESA